MARIASTHKLLDALQAEGIPTPDGCREARLIMEVNSAIMIQFDVFVSEDYLAKLGRALIRLSAGDY